MIENKIDISRYTGLIKTADTMIIGNPVHLNSDKEVEVGVLADGDIPIGVVESVTANWGVASDFVGDGTKEVTVVSGIILTGITVTGVSALTDTNAPVYLSAANAYTVVKPASGSAVGFIYNWVSGTSCDIFMYGLKENAVGSSAGSLENLDLGTLGTSATGLEAANAASLNTILAKGNFKITSLHAKAAAFDAGSVAGAQTLTLEINGVPTTGGILSLGFGDNDAASDMGVAIDATAITALNEVVEGDSVELTLIAGGTGFTASKAGKFNFYAVIERV